MKRRDFLKALAATGAASWTGDWLAAFAEAAQHPSVGSKWTGWRKGEFQVHFIYTGVAESMFYIFPDGTTMLLDCGDIAAHKRKLKVPILPSLERHSGEWVARYLERVNPNGRDIDYMLLSHFHSDHGGCDVHHAGITSGRDPDYCLAGLAQVAETFRFRTAIDRGWPAYDDPQPMMKSGQTLNVLANMRALYAHLGRRDGLKAEKFRLGARDQIVPRRGDAPGFATFNFAANGHLCSPKTGEILEPYADYRDRYANGKRAYNENGMSLGTLFTYGDFTFYTGGDLSDVIDRKKGVHLEDSVAKIMSPVDVAKLNHHGHHAMTPALAKALDARCYVACVWDQLHCTPDTMENLETGPGRHTYFPGIVPTIDCKDGKRLPWMAKVPPLCWEGAHTVLTVPPGGKTFTMTLLPAADESMTVKAVYDFNSRGSQTA